MLYDILFIDDDFDEQSDAIPWGNNAQKLFLEFVRDNLRATYTSGELDDLEKLESKDLSCIKYIFCDLHLLSINENDSYKQINSKLLRIFEYLEQKIKLTKITLFLNSTYISSYGEEGEKHLEQELKKLKIEYKLKTVGTKNKLSKGNKEELLKNHLDIHTKSLLINKALEIESIFDEKLKLSSTSKEKVSFQNKYLVFQSQFNLDKNAKCEIQLLQAIRNKLAHTNNELSGITDKGIKKRFGKFVLVKKLMNRLYLIASNN